MFQVLGYLVLENDATEADITNAIYLALVYEESRYAGDWITLGKQKYTKSDSLLALEAWYLRKIQKSGEAQVIIDEIL